MNYRSARQLGMSRRGAILALVPLRLRVAVNALLGRPVAYRLSIEGTVAVDRPGVVAECRFGGMT